MEKGHIDGIAGMELLKFMNVFSYYMMVQLKKKSMDKRRDFGVHITCKRLLKHFALYWKGKIIFILEGTKGLGA